MLSIVIGASVGSIAIFIAVFAYCRRKPASSTRRTMHRLDLDDSKVFGHPLHRRVDNTPPSIQGVEGLQPGSIMMMMRSLPAAPPDQYDNIYAETVVDGLPPINPTSAFATDVQYTPNSWPSAMYDSAGTVPQWQTGMYNDGPVRQRSNTVRMQPLGTVGPVYEIPMLVDTSADVSLNGHREI